MKLFFKGGFFMKRIISTLLLLSIGLSLLLSLSSCDTQKNVNDVSCEEIIAAYEAAGYTLGYHLHEDPVYLQEGICCCLMFQDPKTHSNQNDIYINRYNTVEDAAAAADKQRYNIVLWLFCLIYGEPRWLQSEQFGKLHCTTYEKDMILPLREAVN